MNIKTQSTQSNIKFTDDFDTTLEQILCDNHKLAISGMEPIFDRRLKNHIDFGLCERTLFNVGMEIQSILFVVDPYELGFVVFLSYTNQHLDVDMNGLFKLIKSHPSFKYNDIEMHQDSVVILMDLGEFSEYQCSTSVEDMKQTIIGMFDGFTSENMNDLFAERVKLSRL
jgi:hypothetical protein